MAGGLHVHSEIGELRRVMLHRPAGELLNLSPDTLGPLLFDDIPFLRVAQEEHDAFADMLRQEGVEVVYLEDLVGRGPGRPPGGAPRLLRAMAGRVRRRRRGRALGRLRAAGLPSTSRALVDKCVEGVRADELDLTPSAHASLADLMALSAGRTGELVVDPIPNVYFTRDTFSVIGQGVSHNRRVERHAPPRVHLR